MKKGVLRGGAVGAPGGIRTHDHLLRRQPLYPLSYWDTLSTYREWYPPLEIGFKPPYLDFGHDYRQAKEDPS